MHVHKGTNSFEVYSGMAVWAKICFGVIIGAIISGRLEKGVKELIEDLKVNELPTIQYSPQLNEVAECLFGCSKAKVKPAQFPHTVMKRKVTKTAITNWINAVAQFDAQVSMKGCRSVPEISKNHEFFNFSS